MARSSDNIEVNKKKTKSTVPPRQTRSRVDLITDKHISKCFALCGYNMGQTAKAVNISRTSLTNLIDTRPALRQLLAEEQKNRIEMVECKLFQKIEEGDTKAIMFFLERRSPHYKKSVELIANVKTFSRQITHDMDDEDASKAYKDALLPAPS